MANTQYTDLQSALFNEWPFQRYNDGGTLLAIAQKALNDANRSITNSERWPFRIASASGASPLTITDLASQADIISVVNSASGNYPLMVLSRGEVEALYNDLTVAGSPQVAYVAPSTGSSAGQSAVKTVPVGGTLLVNYFKTAPLLSNGTDEPLMPEEWRYLIVTAAAARLATRKGDTSIQFQATSELSDGLSQMAAALMDQVRYVLPVGTDS